MRTFLRPTGLCVGAALALSGCGFTPYDLPLPGGADVGNDPFTVTVQFRDVLDLVPQSAVRVDDIAVGKVTDIELDGWTAVVTLQVNDEVELPDNAEATIRQSGLLGEKFVSLDAPTQAGSGRLGNGDTIPLERSGRNPEIEEVLGAASLLFNGGGLEKTNSIVRELNNTLSGNEPEIKELLKTTTTFVDQLDANKAKILTALEKINDFSVATNKQRDSLENALDDLPAALRTINAERDDLVGLLEALDRLSGIATDVIRRSKSDTLAALRDLQPVLRELANAGDSLPAATSALLSFPFTDAVVGDSVSRATSTVCNARDLSNAQKIRQGSCFGDFYNLQIGLQLDASQAANLVSGLLSLVTSQPAAASPENGAGNGAQRATVGESVDRANTSDVGRLMLLPVVTR